MTDAPQAPAFTIDLVMKTYHDTNAQIDVISKRHQEELAPLVKRVELTKAWMLHYLNQQGLENARCEHGLAYKSTMMSTTVDPDGGWDKLLSYILERAIGRGLDVVENGGDDTQALAAVLSDPALGLFNRAVNKTMVKEMLEQGAAPPGVKIAHITQVNVRRN